MAKPANTIDRYDVDKSVREDLADIIYNISPDDTPFMSNIGRGKAANTYFEWQTDALKPANKDNAVLDGDDAENDERDPTNRLGNYTQISRKVIGTTGTAEAVTKAGMKSVLAYEMSKASAELKTDMEATLTSNNAAVIGNSATPRKTAGLAAFLRTNVNFNPDTGENPTLSSGSDGFPNAGRTAGTAREFTEEHLKDVLKKVWSEGGKLKLVMVGPHNKTVVSGFPGIAERRFSMNTAKSAAIIGAADIYVSDFGNVAIVPNRFQPEEYAYVLDTDYASVEYLRDFQTADLAKTGDSKRKMILVEYGLKVGTEKAHGVIADLETA